MAKLIIITREGKQREIEGETGISVMENIQNSGIDELLALCGGACSCATCHIHIDSNTLLPQISDDENDLLDSSDHRNDMSRLSCQLIFSDELDGLQVTIAAED